MPVLDCGAVGAMATNDKVLPSWPNKCCQFSSRDIITVAERTDVVMTPAGPSMRWQLSAPGGCAGSANVVSRRQAQSLAPGASSLPTQRRASPLACDSISTTYDSRLRPQSQLTRPSVGGGEPKGGRTGQCARLGRGHSPVA